MEIPDNRFAAIAQQISSDESPVGIDARKTHVIIIHMLEDIQQRITDLEHRLIDLEQRLENPETRK